MKFCIESGIIFDRDIWEIGAAGEHFLHTEGVIGSIPVTPTIKFIAGVIYLGFFIARQS